MIIYNIYVEMCLVAIEVTDSKTWYFHLVQIISTLTKLLLFLKNYLKHLFSCILPKTWKMLCESAQFQLFIEI